MRAAPTAARRRKYTSQSEGEKVSARVEEYFAVTAPGAAIYTAEELQRLGLIAQPAALRTSARRRGKRAGEVKSGSAPGGDLQGGVAFSGGSAALYRANLHLRTANRVLLRLGHFSAVGFAELRKRAAQLPWERCLWGGAPVALRVTCHKSRLYHSDAVAERVAAAIGDRLGQASGIQKFDEEAEGAPPQLVVVRLLHDVCTISLDSSGELLHRRGYRLATAKAPLRETLAATMLMAAGWHTAAKDAPSILLDPFCGSGTIPIEAALMATGTAPGLATGQARRYTFMQWPDFDAGLWRQLVEEAGEQQRIQTEQCEGRFQIAGSDRDAGAIAAAQANAARAHMAEWIELQARPFSAIAADAGAGMIVTNPPYGLRVSPDRDLRNLYAQFGNVLRAGFGGWRLAVLCSDRQLLGQLGIPLDTSTTLVNGGVSVFLGRGTV
jgi:putative N6-adenine-specific DNA methylase